MNVHDSELAYYFDYGLDYDEDATNGTKVTVICGSGMEGSWLLTCQDGEWHGEMGECVKGTCQT